MEAKDGGEGGAGKDRHRAGTFESVIETVHSSLSVSQYHPDRVSRIKVLLWFVRVGVSVRVCMSPFV